MPLKEAIEILYELIRINKHVAIPGHLGAIKLGIEALKLINSMGECPYCHVGFTLPGETEE